MRKSLLFFSLLFMATASAQSGPAGKLSGAPLLGAGNPAPAVNTVLHRATNAVLLQQPKKSEYTRIPLGQSQQPVYSAVVTNNNPDPVSAQVRLRVFDAAMTEIGSGISAAVSLNSSETSAPLTVVPVFNITTTGLYTFTYDAVIDGTPDPTTTSSYTVEYTTAQMARDDSTITGGLGIGAGEGGYLGNAFTFSSAATLASVDIYQLGANISATEMGCAIFKLVGGTPQLVYTAPSQQIPLGTAAGWIKYPVSPPLTVNAGDTFVVCAQEFTQIIRVGLTTTVFTTGTTYVNWPSIPFGGWANNEAFGGSYTKPYMIRPNLGCTLPDPVVDTTQEFCAGATVNHLSATGTGIEWFEDAAGGTALATNTVLATGTYYVSQNDGSCLSERVAVAVTVTPLTNNTTTIEACDSYLWAVNGTTYTASGTYDLVTDCHTETLELTITPSTSNTTVINACDSYTWAVNGITYTDSGMYEFVNGCHTETLQLAVTPSTSSTTTISACDSFTWDESGMTYTESGMYEVVNGCHTEVLNLTITPSTSSTTTISACDSFTWDESGMTYTDSGMYEVVNGCHTEMLNLTITPSTSSTTTISACDSFTWDENGMTYTESGLYEIADGCHTEILDLMITPSTSNLTQINTCGSYTWNQNGVTYTETGVYEVVNGCHTETLELAITPITSNTTVISACDSYYWNQTEITYTESGIYEVVNGCHTETLELTITPSTSSVTAIIACDSFTWDENGVTYTESGMYEIADGCHTEALELTIIPSTSNLTQINTCGSYTWSQNDVTYTESGVYEYVNGCHTEVLELAIIPITSNTTVISACDSYMWNQTEITYTESGTYEVVNGCNTETLELTITTTPVITQQPVDAEVAQGNPATFSVAADNAGSYQWQGSIDGGQSWLDIPEGNGVSGTDTNTLVLSAALVTLQANGAMFRVVITNGSCTATSDAAVLAVFLGIDTIEKGSVVLYPNPTKGSVRVTTTADAAMVTVFDMNGRLIRTQELGSGNGDIDLSNVNAGVYLFKVTTENGVINQKVVKQ